jgi:hypothetical protein
MLYFTGTEYQELYFELKNLKGHFLGLVAFVTSLVMAHFQTGH